MIPRSGLDTDAARAPTTAAGAVGDAGADRQGTTDGRYTLVRELARGGMGRIWIADDARLSRRVAIKELLEGSGSRGARFERELSLTSRLEHPSIVSIHDGGTWADGKPFYVMKVVSGESLDRVIARARSVSDRIALLPHGLALVDALAYAHAQGIVHRDLKPENVLIGDFGETVVIDWGLAKDLRAATPELIDGPYRELAREGVTIGGEVMGTPAYMPPEQALGDAVDERADVYALGAVLYHLLSGARPHAGNTIEEVLANVISAPPPPLARRAPGVPADLVTIVEKAMAWKPEDRYATAGELAVDLKRFLSGQLVGAHRYSGRQLVWRWLRKHRTAVVVAAVAVVALVTLGAVSFTRIVREERHAQEARSLAERNRAQADDRRVAVEGLMAFMLGDLRERLEPIGKLAILELPARKALAYYDDRRDQLDPGERQSRAVALENLGDVLRSRGELAGAEAQYQEALAVRRQLTMAGHTQPEWRYRDASLQAAIGDLHQLQGASLEAIRDYRAAIATLSELSAARPDDRRGPRGHMLVLEKLGSLLTARRDFAGAEREHRAALAIATQRATAAPDDIEAQLDVVGPQNTVGDTLAAAGDPAGALTAYRATLARITALTERAPEDTRRVRMLHLTHQRIGVVLATQGDVTGALQHYRASAALCERLVAHDPQNSGWQYEHAIITARLAEALQASGDSTNAIAAYRRGISILRTLTERDPSNTNAARERLVLQIQLSELLGGEKKWREAEVEAREAVAIGEQRAELDPSNRQTKHDLGTAYATLGTVLLELQRPDDALANYLRGLAVARALATAEPADNAAQFDLQQSLVEVANARCATRRGGAAPAEYQEALAISARHRASSPEDENWRLLDDDARAAAKACRP